MIKSTINIITIIIVTLGAIGIAFVMGFDFIGTAQGTAEQETDIISCNYAVQLLSNHPGKLGSEECFQKYCKEAPRERGYRDEYWEDRSCKDPLQRTHYHHYWEIKKCIYDVNDQRPSGAREDCNCEPFDTGIRTKEKPDGKCAWKKTRIKRACIMTDGYDTPGLRKKMDVYSFCGYDLTEEEESEEGVLVGERTELRYKIGKIMYLACEHGIAVNEVDDYPFFVEMCEAKIDPWEYSSADCETVIPITTAGFRPLVQVGTADGACLPDGVDQECATKYFNNPMKYYMCRDDIGNPDAPKCEFKWATAGSEPFRIAYNPEFDDGASPLFRAVIVRNVKPLSGGSSSFINDEQEAMFCG